MVSSAVENLQSAKNQLLAKISGLENEVKQIESVIAGLETLNGGEAAATVAIAAVVEVPVVAGTRVMSAATKAKMKKAQQARWAKINAAKAESAPVAAKSAAKRKKMSPLGKLKIKLGSLNRYGKTAEAKKVKALIAALEGK